VLDLPAFQDEYLHTSLSGEAARVYDQMEHTLLAWLETASAPVIAQNAMSKLMFLARIASGHVKDESGVEHWVHHNKEDLLAELLDDLPPDEPVVVFARFRFDLEAIHRAAEKCGRLSGELSGEVSARRDLQAWQRGRREDPTVLAAQIQSGSVAIDLTRARIAVFYSIGFKLDDYTQARARVYRTGQTRPVMYYHLIARNTVDELIRRALMRREDLIESVLKELPCYRQVSMPKTMNG
jgi:SNF2 family DNA or RNA helicase